MAFTTAPLPMDKEQGPFWQGGDELAVANDNLFDQFVSFETVEPAAFDCEFLNVPPSPSMLLNSLNCLTNSSDSQDQPPALPLPEAAARPAPQMFSAQHTRSVPALYGPPDPALGRGSISDSELLRLEGISLRSPRANNSAPSSPRLMPSSPTSPRKNKRFIDCVHATVRRATHRSRPPRPPIATAPPANIKAEPGQLRNVAGNAMVSAFVPIDSHDRPLPESIDCHGLSLSPPLTGKLPTAGQQPKGMQFVTSHLEDPFTDGFMAMPPAPSRTHDQHTPLNTPVFKADAFFYNAPPPADPAHITFQKPKQRSTSSAEWPVDSAGADGPHRPDNRSLWASGSWEEDAVGIGAPLGAARRMPPTKLPYEAYAADLSGLMIHMPQPRAPQAAVLTAHIAEPALGTPATPRQPAALAYPSASPHRPHGLYTERRPQPRAPSSGARHLGGSVTSPRKPSLHHSASRPLLVHREESPSPTPSRLRSSSMSVRKQRSWSRREPRTPNPPAGSPGLGGGGSGGIDFVNFTPSDKNLIMHGVAPSGSSKTKARREKEAMDRRQKLNEAAVKAIEAAGGDMDGLVAAGFSF